MKKKRKREKEEIMNKIMQAREGQNEAQRAYNMIWTIPTYIAYDFMHERTNQTNKQTNTHTWPLNSLDVPTCRPVHSWKSAWQSTRRRLLRSRLCGSDVGVSRSRGTPIPMTRFRSLPLLHTFRVTKSTNGIHARFGTGFEEYEAIVFGKLGGFLLRHITLMGR